MAKLFTIAGTSTLKGVSTFRFATGLMKNRIWVLRHNGHTDIELYELPKPMTKEDAIVFLQSNGIATPDTVLPNAPKVKEVIVQYTKGHPGWDQATLDARWVELDAEHFALEAEHANRVAKDLKNEKRRMARAATKQ